MFDKNKYLKTFVVLYILVENMFYDNEILRLSLQNWIKRGFRNLINKNLQF